jgi:hypothetical protein
VSRLGLQETITLESALFLAAESPTSSDAALGLVRELQTQSAAGVDLGIGGYWSGQLRDLDTTTWNATVTDAVARLTPAVVAALLSSNSPLPVPSFDEFVALSYAATFALESNAAFRNLYKQATKLGIRALGNLLRLGKIAFAPDTPAVRQLVAHLNASHAFFGDHLAGVWPTEAAAVAELNRGGKGGLWAIVAMRDGYGGGEQDYDSEYAAPSASPPSGQGQRAPPPPPPGRYSAPCQGAPHCSRYAIRMRFTVVPGTQAAFKRWSRVSDAYLSYYTSGFLTIQHAVDNTLLRMTAGVAPGDVTTRIGSRSATSAAAAATSSSSASSSASTSGGELLFAAAPVPWWGSAR